MPQLKKKSKFEAKAKKVEIKKEVKIRKDKLIYKYGFVSLFFVLLFVSIVLKTNFINLSDPVWLNLASLRIYIAVLAVVLGVITLITHKKPINGLIEKEFGEKVTINISEKSSFIKRFIKKEGVTSLILLSLIFFVAIFNFSYKLTHYDIFEDEFQMMSVSTGYYHTGEFKHWDRINDSINEGSEYGVKPQIWLLAQAYNFFGLSKATARGLSVIMGLFFVLTSYFFSRHFIKNKLVSLLVPLSVIFFPPYLHLFRYIRMYALVIPLTLVVFWGLYRAITEECRIKTRSNAFNSFIEKYLNFNFIYIIISIPLIIINYQLHQVSLITLPVIFIFILYLAITEKEVKYYIASIAGFLLILVIALFFNDFLPKQILTFFENKDWSYLDWIFAYPFSSYITIPVLIIGISSFFIVKNKTL